MRRLPRLLFVLLLASLMPGLEPTARGQAGRGRRGGQAPAAPAPVDEAPASQRASPEPFRTAGDRPIDIQHIRLDLKVDLPKKTIDARATLNFKSLRPLSHVSLDAVDFEVRGVWLIDGDKAP